MSSKMFGYIRVSSVDQNEARQVDTMQGLGVSDRDVFIDKASGKDTDRPQYQALKSVVREGDTVIFDSITRLSRNMNDIKAEYEWFIKNGVSLQFVKEPMLNTKADVTDVMQRAISDIILTLLAAFAEKERTDIKQRQREGIDAAKRRGKHLGRPRKSFATMSAIEQQAFIAGYDAWKKGEHTAVDTFTKLDIPKATFYRIVKEYEALS